MLTRADEGLAFLLQYENIAWYEKGTVRILDRRVYPMDIRFVTCTTYQAVAQAIQDMVTQSAGPYLAAAMGMALAAHQAVQHKPEHILTFLEQAAYSLSHARPTTSEQMKGIVEGSLQRAQEIVGEGGSAQDLVDALFSYAVDYVNTNYQRYSIIGTYMAELIPANGTVMTQCFGDTIVGTMLRACKNAGKQLQLICAETRPYFQGSRLTASVACDMGVPVTVISDNMPAFTLKTKHVDLFTSASDVITGDGHIINKVGTFQIALAAHYYHIPYYVTGTPDPKHPDLSRITIEERDPALVLMALDKKITMDGVQGYYPAFDITPPELCSGIVTDKGIYKPARIMQYFTKDLT